MNARKRRESSNPKPHLNKQVKEHTQKPVPKKENKPYNGINYSEFREDFGFCLQDIKSWENFVKLMYKQMDPASLGLIRIMFGNYICI